MSRTYVERASVVSLDDELLSERIEKQFLIGHQPFVSADDHIGSLLARESPVGASHVRMHFAWRVERNKIRGMGVDSWTAKLVATTVDANGADGEERVVLKANDCVEDADMELFDQFCEEIGLSTPERPLPLADRVWFISYLCSHPSDFAFDAISRALRPRE